MVGEHGSDTVTSLNTSSDHDGLALTDTLAELSPSDLFPRALGGSQHSGALRVYMLGREEEVLGKVQSGSWKEVWPGEEGVLV